MESLDKKQHEYSDEVKGPIKGSIYRVNQDRGFAFATGEDKRDYFILYKEMSRSGKGSLAFRNLQQGMQVEFEYKENLDLKSAPAALNVRVVTQ
jgi:cold shock CspA family protein